MEGETKTCIKCGEVKTVDLFVKNKNMCIKCRKEYLKERYKDPAIRERHKEYSKERYHTDPVFREQKKVYQKERRKDPAVRERQKEYDKGRSNERYKDPVFREQKKVYQKERRKDPAVRERQKEYFKERYKDPVFRGQQKVYKKERCKDPAVREQRKEYLKERYHTDPVFRLACNLRNRIRSALKAQSAKKLHSFNKLLGCTPAEARAHITAQFKPGMGWDNYRHDTWHIDHIRPLDSFDLTDPQQQLDANHYTNLQPLWGPENMAKGAKWEPTEEVTYDKK